MVFRAAMSGFGPTTHPTRHPLKHSSFEAVPTTSVRARVAIPGSVSLAATSTSAILVIGVFSSNVHRSYTSSATMTTSNSAHSRAISFVSVSLNINPVGLCGLQWMNAFVLPAPATKASRKSSRRNRNRLLGATPSSRRRTVRGVAPKMRACDLYHGKKGSRKTTSSPGSHRACSVTYSASVADVVTKTSRSTESSGSEPVAR
mmetsp:Transcript_3668/g.14782  ORF Transcript_3668/g.14782 Transcript_3668/m.14782 type:complete len:203 (-) Transcript_3668:285-893(-)